MFARLAREPSFGRPDHDTRNKKVIGWLMLNAYFSFFKGVDTISKLPGY